jgi:hypothetical protein
VIERSVGVGGVPLGFVVSQVYCKCPLTLRVGYIGCSKVWDVVEGGVFKGMGCLRVC